MLVDDEGPRFDGAHDVVEGGSCLQCGWTGCGDGYDGEYGCEGELPARCGGAAAFFRPYGYDEQQDEGEQYEHGCGVVGDVAACLFAGGVVGDDDVAGVEVFVEDGGGVCLVAGEAEDEGCEQREYPPASDACCYEREAEA